MATLILPAAAGKAGDFFDHTQRHFAESGEDDIIFHPISDFRERKREEQIAQYQSNWKKSLQEVGWERVWCLEIDGVTCGHVALMGAHLTTRLHRATLGIGIEKRARKKGLSTKLMKLAISFAREQPSLDWLDLYVFAHNEVALRLYEKMGFSRSHQIEDLFRVNSQKITDIHMSLKLKSS